MTKSRLAIVESETSISAIEQKINCGQVEELVMQAEDELTLAKNMVDLQVNYFTARFFCIPLANPFLCRLVAMESY